MAMISLLLMMINHYAYKEKVLSKNSISAKSISILGDNAMKISAIEISGKEYDFDNSINKISNRAIKDSILYQNDLINRMTTGYWPWEDDSKLSLRPYAIIKVGIIEIFWFIVDRNDKTFIEINGHIKNMSPNKAMHPSRYQE